MAELTGKPMEKIVNWFMLLIIFVFDPLAIALVVAANMALGYKPEVIASEAVVEEKEDVQHTSIEEINKLINQGIDKHIRDNPDHN